MENMTAKDREKKRLLIFGMFMLMPIFALIAALFGKEHEALSQLTALMGLGTVLPAWMAQFIVPKECRIAATWNLIISEMVKAIMWPFRKGFRIKS